MDEHPVKLPHPLFLRSLLRRTAQNWNSPQAGAVSGDTAMPGIEWIGYIPESPKNLAPAEAEAKAMVWTPRT